MGWSSWARCRCHYALHIPRCPRRRHAGREREPVGDADGAPAEGRGCLVGRPQRGGTVTRCVRGAPGRW